MKFTLAALASAFSLLTSPCLAEEASPDFDVVGLQQLDTIINGEHHKPDFDDGEVPRIFFCEGENWGPPCYVYFPELEYTCTRLAPEQIGKVGSVYVDQGIICRLATYSDDRCAPFKFVAWPEIEGGWGNLTDWKAPKDVQTSEKTTVGELTTHFTCARCDNCPPPQSRTRASG
ncbi:hypothetical protein B0T10DRAFT_212224 [Thelonectria olida]|uniref:Uncharacterized protein n=1 Tax=Thelonectria olida TaxID=1576542 RepID=A0A9P8WF42_9HYPO|nr:hypothetical protein B0T10DRAFT_212224 [Thelonectria olida]